MAKPRNDEPAFGSDSFLDVITNVVGIVIILVMLVGMRIKHAPPPQPDTRADELAAATQTAETLEEDVLRLKTSLAAIDAEEQGARGRLAGRLAQAPREEELASQLADGRRRFQKEIEQSQRSLLDLQRQLADLQGQLKDAMSVRPKITQIQSYPSPVSRTVDGPEAHFQLLGGRVAYVPFKELAGMMESDVYRKMSTLRNSPELAAVVGPLRGFSLSYTIKHPEGSSMAYLAKVTFVPESSQMGESLNESLRADSSFRAALAQYDSKTTVVTLWTYPDSFAEYRRLKKDLYELGYSVAGRPLPHGRLITGSPSGSRSAAQ
ncbi:MAG: hypothetical protein HYS13_00225 [Planctomycetia bacterium]|nr:hypothetical protein [Planctomycetia bacterium]